MSPSQPNADPSPDMHLRLPGFGLPVNWGKHRKECFPYYYFTGTPLTLRELCMLVFMNQITDKPDWNKKVLDDGILAKWRAEAMSIDWTEAGVRGGSFTDEMFDYCIRELKDKAELFEKTGFVTVLDIQESVVKSDTAVSPELKQALRDAVAPLENVPETELDWHPGTSNVLDLVHPSLYPLVYGRSRVLPDRLLRLEDALAACGTGELIPQPEVEVYRDPDVSTRFQWLPCEISFPDGGRDARITSYINNLHPRRHADLYGVIEKLITCSVPLWNVVYKGVMGGKDTSRYRIQHMNIVHECSRGGGTECSCDYSDRPLNEGETDEDRDEDLDMEWHAANHPAAQPVPGEYTTPASVANPGDGGFENGGLVEVAGRRLQVIVKVASIHLGPNEEKYEGGSWHVEGMENERICATSLYYYDSENITESRLHFRVNLDEDDLLQDLGYEQGDYSGIEAVFGFEKDDPAVQPRDHVATPEGRLIAFPNVLQHRVAPFELADKTKPGHRKIVALFLVDPASRVLSTANVPPQRRDWWVEGLEHVMPNGRLGTLPPEITQMVLANADDMMTREEAEKVREELMAERTADGLNRAEWDVPTFSFCEH